MVRGHVKGHGSSETHHSCEPGSLEDEQAKIAGGLDEGEKREAAAWTTRLIRPKLTNTGPDCRTPARASLAPKIWWRCPLMATVVGGETLLAFCCSVA